MNNISNYYLFSLFLLLSNYTSISAQGLLIKGNDYLINDRSSYNVFEKNEVVFSNNLSVTFEISPLGVDPAYRIGYITRIKNLIENTTYNVLYNDQGSETVFKLNHEGKDVLITAVVNRESIANDYWIKMGIHFDMQKDSIHLDINGKRFSAGGLDLGNKWKPAIHFGRSEHVIDIPSYELHNLSVGNDNKKYFFPLKESDGELVHDSHGKVIGHVINPVWLINKAYYWEAGPSFSSETVAGSNFNPKTQDVYYFSKDSVIIYNVRTKHIEAHVCINECPINMRLGTNFIDWSNKLLYVYEVSDPLSGDIMIAALSLDTFEWSPVSTEILPRQLHHHSNYLDEDNRCYLIFGGFGNLHYSNNFYSYHIEENYWERVELQGDNITPRYFTSMGNDEDSQTLYVFGGMGNESGDQSVGRVYYYELYKVDLNNKRITKMWEIPWKNENMVPVRGMVITDDNFFYTLCYPEHFSNSSLNLYRFSITDGSYEIVGDSIPILSEKIKTHANLYYNKRSNELFSIVQEFDYDDIASTARVYSLSFPPVTKEGLTRYKNNSSVNWLWISIAGFFGIQLFIIIFMIKRKKRKLKDVAFVVDKDTTSPNKELIPNTPQRENRPNSIYLFGGFSIIDRNNREINYMFSAKLKQAFLLILYSGLENGITSQQFSKIIWPDKPEDKVKNSRGVILNNLRKILGELDGINLIHEKGFYKIVFSGECYCDYLRCLEISKDINMEGNLEEFVSIISAGKFLKSVDEPWIDPFKEYMERNIEPGMFLGMEKAYLSGNYKLTVSLCDGVFYFDPLNEESLRYQLKSLLKLRLKDEAKRRYLLFAVEYKTTLGEEYLKTITDLTE